MFVTRTVVWKMNTARCLDSLQGGYCHIVFLCSQLWIFINMVLGISEMGLSNVAAKWCSILSSFNFMEPFVHVSFCPLSSRTFSVGEKGWGKDCLLGKFTASIWNPGSVPYMLLFPVPHLVGLLWIPFSPHPAAHSTSSLSKGVFRHTSVQSALWWSPRFCSLWRPHQQCGVGSCSTRFVIFCFYHLEMKEWTDLNRPVAGGEWMF